MKRRFLMLGLVALAGSTLAAKPPAVTAPTIDAGVMLRHIKVLASDEFEGRAPAGKGEELTVSYLIDQFKKLGLEPGNPDGTFIQKVPLVGITPDPKVTLTFKKGGQQQELRFKDDFVAWTKHLAETAGLDDSDLVFVGYGIVAPEFQWDDYKGLDLRGKTLVMLVGDPPVPDPADPKKLDPKVFGGEAMTYYGRWTYKYEIGMQKGAAGVLIVHETGPAGYPFTVIESKTTEQFDLVRPDRGMSRVSVEGWIARGPAQKLFALAGEDLPALKKKAASRDFRPLPLGVTAKVRLRNTVRTIESRNVIARLQGRDPALKDEYVAYTAHWDHLGVGPEVNGDRIYNGAVDNASGTAGLIEMARAYTQYPRRPKRSILFLAVTAEEQGLLGSEYYSLNPLHPLAKTLASINMDGLNVHGRTKDVTIVGLGNSDLDDYARAAAAEQGRVLRPDPEPEKGFYYRSDHFNFAKQGVPALDPDEGIDFVGRPPGYGKEMRDHYTRHDYHKPSDEVKAEWDLSGAVEDLRLLWSVGYGVAEADRYPEWKPGTEFRARRESQLRAK